MYNVQIVIEIKKIFKYYMNTQVLVDKVKWIIN